MASSRDTSNGPDWKDVAEAISSFEQIDQVMVTVALGTVPTPAGISLMLQATAWPMGGDPTEAKPLASARSTCSATGLRSLEAAVIHVLYALDFQLAAEAARRVYDQSA